MLLPSAFGIEFIVTNNHLRASKGYHHDLVEANSTYDLTARGYNVLSENVELSISALSWGLDRMDQPYGMNNEYNPAYTGSNVDVYVIDTGINKGHPEFLSNNQVKGGFSIFDDGPYVDCNSHGTFVASLIGGEMFGIAKGVDLYSVRVLDCTGRGTLWGLVQAVNWVTTQISLSGKRSVVNCSFQSTTANTFLDGLMKTLYDKGSVVVVAAGNNQQDACSISPGREPIAITVGALTKTDGLHVNSNFGPCVDFFAPGENVPGANTFTFRSTVRSGTSVATALITGYMATLVEEFPKENPKQISKIATRRSIQVREPCEQDHRPFVYVKSTPPSNVKRGEAGYVTWNSIIAKGRMEFNATGGKLKGILISTTPTPVAYCTKNRSTWVRVDLYFSQWDAYIPIPLPQPLTTVRFKRTKNRLDVTVNGNVSYQVVFKRYKPLYASIWGEVDSFVMD